MGGRLKPPPRVDTPPVPPLAMADQLAAALAEQERLYADRSAAIAVLDGLQAEIEAMQARHEAEFSAWQRRSEQAFDEVDGLNRAIEATIVRVQELRAVMRDPETMLAEIKAEADRRFSIKN